MVQIQRTCITHLWPSVLMTDTTIFLPVAMLSYFIKDIDPPPPLQFYERNFSNVPETRYVINERLPV